MATRTYCDVCGVEVTAGDCTVVLLAPRSSTPPRRLDDVCRHCAAKLNAYIALLQEDRL